MRKVQRGARPTEKKQKGRKEGGLGVRSSDGKETLEKKPAAGVAWFRKGRAKKDVEKRRVPVCARYKTERLGQLSNNEEKDRRNGHGVLREKETQTEPQGHRDEKSGRKGISKNEWDEAMSKRLFLYRKCSRKSTDLDTGREKKRRSRRFREKQNQKTWTKDNIIEPVDLRRSLGGSAKAEVGRA